MLKSHLATAKFLGQRLELWPDAELRGISRTTFDAALGGLTADARALEYCNNQPEHTRTIGQYFEVIVSTNRIATGQTLLAQIRKPLEKIQTRYAVDGHILLAIWGIESNYGLNVGNRNIVHSLATLAHHDDRRGDFWRSQLLAALQILERGDVQGGTMSGSWAGAMGHTQLIPTTYLSYAVDFDGDGRCDVWNSVQDALASAANYLKASGWQGGQPWGHEVVIPTDFDFGLSGRHQRRPIADWQALGLKRADGKELGCDRGSGALLVPMGASGPAFLIKDNFDAILCYNRSIAYALSVGHLADRLQGRHALVRPWPIERALVKTEREELQRLLVEQGYTTGGVDGIFGTATHTAAQSYQAAQGLVQDGYPGPSLLDWLRKEVEGHSHV